MEMIDKLVVKPLSVTDYQNREFVIEDIDGRYLAFGLKQKKEASKLSRLKESS